MPAKNYLVRNQTPHELVLVGPKHVLRLSPLERRLVGGEPDKLIGLAAEFARTDHAVGWELEPSRARRLLTMAWLAGLAFAGLAFGLIGTSFGGGLAFAIVGGAWCAAFLLAVGGMVLWRWRRPPDTDKAPDERLDPSPPRSDVWDLARDLGISLVQGLVAVVLVIVAVGAPALAIYYGTELQRVIRFVSWDHWKLADFNDYHSIVVARFIQLFLVILTSVLPALMFYQFDREKLSTLVDRWLHAIFRLDPTLHTVADVDAKYGRRVEEFFGASLAVGVAAPQRRLRNRSPVVTTTLLIAIGWIIALVNSDVVPGRGTDLFAPAARPMTFAFLGAYFLCIQVTLRGYVRGDLKPKTFNVLSVRILMAVVLAWALQGLAGTNPATLATSFLAGIIPNTVLRQIRDISAIDRVTTRWAKPTAAAVLASQMRQLPKREAGKPVSATPTAETLAAPMSAPEISAPLIPAPEMQQPEGQPSKAQSAEPDPPPDDLEAQAPLSLLDEIDVYERTRLEEEGITCIQALARHDLIDLMLSSRIPVPRLVDWVDQAVLYQHVPTKGPALRRLGIRNATDLERLCAKAGDLPADQRDVVMAELAATLGVGQPEMLLAMLDGDEWLKYIRNWRDHDQHPDPITVYAEDGEAVLVDRRADGSSPPVYELRQLTAAGVAARLSATAPIALAVAKPESGPPPQSEAQPQAETQPEPKAKPAPEAKRAPAAKPTAARPKVIDITDEVDVTDAAAQKPAATPKIVEQATSVEQQASTEPTISD